MSERMNQYLLRNYQRNSSTHKPFALCTRKDINTGTLFLNTSTGSVYKVDILN